MSRIVTTYDNKTREYKEYRIYTSEEEIHKAGVPYHTRFETIPEKGEYVRSFNGLYVPVVSHRTFIAKKKNIKDGSYYHNWIFPRFRYLLYYSATKDRLSIKHFIYPLDVILAGGNASQMVNRRLNFRERFAAQMFVYEKVELHQAFYLAYQGTKNIAYIEEIINKTLLSYRFVSYVKELGGLEMLKDRLDEAGLDFAKIVKRLEDMVDNGDSNDAKWAIKTIGDFYDKEPMVPSNNSQNNINIGLLPSEVKPNSIPDQLPPEKNLKQLQQQKEDNSVQS